MVRGAVRSGHRRRVSITALLAAAGGCLSAGCAGHLPLDKGTQSITAAAAPSGRLDVETNNGRVEIRAADVTQVVVEATIRAEGQDRLEQTRVLAEPGADGGLHVYVRWPDGRRRSNEGCSFVVQTPRAGSTGVRVDTSNGEIIVVGQSGEADVDTSNGRVQVSDHRGTVKVDSSNGRIDVENIEGNVRLDTSNGRIEIKDVAGNVYAETSNGSIQLRQARESNSPFELRSSNGSVHVEVGAAFSGEVDAHTSNGVVRMTGAASVDGSKNRARARFGTAPAVEKGESGVADGGRSVIRTSNGTIEVVANR